ncbi:hypothetical protein EWM64_g5557 [Hericium alpestre]|uniref:Uncharacterized protein n=1 Tax=Hericium alpestre TaxID=135208 RepID=A0A4Y9ZWL3_9AGAM|nr:hypothetical protein EWM64_g5557 [Hericium alpestre]
MAVPDVQELAPDLLPLEITELVKRTQTSLLEVGMHSVLVLTHCEDISQVYYSQNTRTFDLEDYLFDASRGVTRLLARQTVDAVVGVDSDDEDDVNLAPEEYLDIEEPSEKDDLISMMTGSFFSLAGIASL